MRQLDVANKDIGQVRFTGFVYNMNVSAPVIACAFSSIVKLATGR